MKPSGKSAITSKRLGVLIGGSGLIGGALTHFYKKTSHDTEVLAPSSKKLSLRVLDDIKQYCRDYHPTFIINAALAPIDSSPEMAFETNYLGSINPAKETLKLFVPYVLARIGKAWIRWIVKIMTRTGIEARIPAELMLIENFYKSQTLSSKNLKGTGLGSWISNKKF